MLFQKYREEIIWRRVEPFHRLDGWLTDSEAIGLYKMAASLDKKAIIVEIGSWQGKSTYCLARGLKTGGRVYAIDPFNGDAGQDVESRRIYEEQKAGKDLEQIFRQNMSALHVMDKIVVKKGYSPDFTGQFPHINALFIDGDHSFEGCSNDFHLYADKIIPGGFLAFHDYYADRPESGPTRVIEELVIPDPRFQFYKLFHSLWTARRVN
jgi:predicted O-methyltransferase YrrM